MSSITVFLADDNLLVRAGVQALLRLEPDIEVVGVAEDYDSLLAGAGAAAPQVLVTDIRMPPTFQQEGIMAAKELRKLHPGTGVVVLSQYDDPEYAISLLGEGSAGYAYLLKDRIAEGDQLAKAVRDVATGGSMLDPAIVEALVHPVRDSDLSEADEEVLRLIAEGRPIKAIAAVRGLTPAAASEEVERLFLRLAQQASTGAESSLRRLRMLHEAIVSREEQGETLSRLLPGGLAEKVRTEGRRIGETERLDVTVLMSDIRGYSTIAEHTDPTVLAGQLNQHRAAMNHAILATGGTVMQFVGDAVMAVFGAPLPTPDHADRSVVAARAMHAEQAALNDQWEAEGREPFGLGIGLSTGEVAAALLGSEERLEYSLVGDTVNLTQRLQQWAEPGQTVLSDPTRGALSQPLDGLEPLEPALVKGRQTPVQAWRLPAERASEISAPVPGPVQGGSE
ncbi:MAG TPA: adenylate/guanylate cyclase domain-containing protein [Actinomycetota bacterium]|nr:adenylate/guanylate cyclase domain-containing protein [Actinomycetota bacterium]